MFIEPSPKLPDIPDHGRPAVFSARMNYQPNGPTDLGGAVGETFRLIQWHEGVGVAVINQDRREIRGHMSDRG